LHTAPTSLLDAPLPALPGQSAMTRILDSHIHMYAPEVFLDPRAWGIAHDEPGWTVCVAPANRKSIQGWATVDRLVADMDRAGIEKCVMLGWYWEREETCALQNGWYLEWTRRHPDRLLAFAAVQPSAGPPALDGLRRALDAGMCGIGEVFPQAQGFSLDDPGWDAVVDLAVEYDVPINLHVTDPLAIDPEVAQPTPLEGYLAIAQRHPKAVFILAHWGGGLPFYELNPRVRQSLANVFYDTAASPLIYDPRVFRQVIDLVGAERVLYGSDYPLLLHPAKSREPEFNRFLADIEAAELTKNESQAILGENLIRLLGLA